MPRQSTLAVPSSLASITGDMSTAAGTIATVAAGGGTVVGSLYCNTFAGQTVWQFLSATSSDCWRFNIESTTGKPFLWTVNTAASGTTNPIAGSGVPLKQWFRFAVTQQISGGNLIGKIYINGRLVAEATSARDVNPDNYFKITSTSSYQKSMFGVYERVLTQQEILQDYVTPLSVPGAEMIFRMDEGAGNILYDSANGLNATGATPTFSNNTPLLSRQNINQNLVKSGDFSYVPKVNVPLTTTNRWYDGTAGGSTTNRLFGINHSHFGTGSTLIDTTELFNGRPTLKLSLGATGSYVEDRLDNPASYNTVKGDGFELLPNTSYRLTFYMKTNYISGDATNGAFIGIPAATGDGTNVTAYNSSAVKTTTPWTKYTVDFTTGSTIRRGHIEARIYGHQGTATLIMDAWFAEITLTPTTPIARGTANRAMAKPVLSSLKLDGAGYATITGGPTDNLGGSGQPMSCAVWVKMDSTHNLANQRFPVCQVTRHLMRIDSNQTVNMGVWGCNVNTVARVQKGIWALLGFTFDGTTGFTYVNGVQDTQLLSTPSGSGANPLTIGVRLGVGSSEFKGQVSNLMYFNRSLTPQEMASIYDGSIPSGLVAHYPLDDGAGTSVRDAKGGVSGVITGGLIFSNDTPSQARKIVDGNLVVNGDLSYLPPTITPTTTSARWLDGTAGGSTTNRLFGWYSDVFGTAAVGFDNTNSFSATHSIELSTLATGSYCGANAMTTGSASDVRVYAIPVIPGATYQLTGYMKTNVTSGDSAHGAAIACLGADGAGNIITTNTTGYIKTTTPWTKYTTTFVAASNARFMFINLRLYGHTGAATLIMDAWFDDIELKQV